MSEQDYSFTGVRADDVQTKVEQSDKYQFHTGNAVCATRVHVCTAPVNFLVICYSK